jgi:hypothetical protein
MREYEQAVRHPQQPQMKHRGVVAPACDDAIVHFDGSGRVARHGSINSGGGGAASDGLSLPLLAPNAPARSEQRVRGRHGMHVSNDNTTAIVKLSEIRADLMCT